MRTVYLNNAATSWPKPPGVAEAMAQAVADMPFHTGRAPARGTDPLRLCRREVARLLDVEDPDRIVLTTNATMALNMAIHGIGLRSGDHVITTVTEHNSVLRPLEHLRLAEGLVVTVVGLDESGAVDEEQFGRALGRGARAVVVNHASNVTGRVNDPLRLFSPARRTGAVTILDASQTLGHVPVKPSELGADMVAFTGHKGLLGPAGTGGLYVAPGLDLEPSIVGGTGVRSDLATQPPDMPTRLEAGTPAIPAFAGLAAALEWRRENAAGFEARTQRAHRLLRSELRRARVRIIDDDAEAPRVGVISILLDGWEVEEAGYILGESFGVICRSGLHCAPLVHHSLGTAPHGTIRLSVSGFTTEEDVARAGAAVRELAA